MCVVNRRFIALAVVIFLLVAPMAAAATHTVRGDLQSFGDGFRALFQADMDGFIDGLLGAMPLFGLIFVVYGLAYFLCVLTLFREKEHQRFAQMIAIGIALLGLAQQSVYNTILGLSTAFLTIAFILAVVFMIIMFLNYSRRRHFETNKDMFDSQKSYLQSKREANKVKHELNKDTGLYKKAERDLSHVDHELSEFDHMTGDELRLVDEISKLLERITSHSEDEHAYVAALRNHIGALMNRLNHERRDYGRLDNLVDRLTHEFDQWGYDFRTETREEKELINILKHHARKKGHTTTKTSEEIRNFINANNHIKSTLAHIRSEFSQLQHIFKQFVKTEEGAFERRGPDYKHNIAIRMRDAALNGDFRGANTQLDHLRHAITKERSVLSKLHHYNNEINRIFSRVERHERELAAHFDAIRAAI